MSLTLTQTTSKPLSFAQATSQLNFALCLHGKLGGWKLAASELRPRQSRAAGGTGTGKQQTGDVWPSQACSGCGRRHNASADAASVRTELRAFARFTHTSLWRHVVQANRAAGHRVLVVLHSWSPEVGADLDALYKPDASKHEPVIPELDKVGSQHLSIKRSLAMLFALPGAPPERVMVARLDLLLYQDMPLQHTLSAPLWLPHSCVSSVHLHLAQADAAADETLIRSACGGSVGGRRVQPPQLSRFNAQNFNLARENDFGMYVLDYFFVGSVTVARSFARISDERAKYQKEISRRIGRGAPQWSHVYWAHHIRSRLAPQGVTPSWLMLHEVDFTLARFWRHAGDCEVPIPAGSRLAVAQPPQPSARPGGPGGQGGPGGPGGPSGPGGGATQGGLLGLVSRASAVVLSRLTPSLYDFSVQFSQQQQRQAHANASSAGGAGASASLPVSAASASAATTDVLAPQCPARFATGESILCQWHNPACGPRVRYMLHMADAAGSFQQQAGLAARQLLGAEQCASTTCLEHTGTANAVARRKQGKRIKLKGGKRRSGDKRAAMAKRGAGGGAAGASVK